MNVSMRWASMSDSGRNMRSSHTATSSILQPPKKKKKGNAGMSGVSKNEW